MPGLSLRGGAGAGFNATAGGLTPYPAQTPTGPRTSTAAAWGVTAGRAPGPRTAHAGVMIAATAGILGLIWLWWALPR